MMKLFCVFLFLIFFSVLYSQENNIPVLEREITVSANNQTLEGVLNNISMQGDFVFSYSPKLINAERRVNLNIRNKSVRYALNQLFEEEAVDYKAKGKYVILRNSGESKTKNDVRIFEGYVYDSKTGKRLTEASVYDKSLLASAISDKYGYFSMEVPADKPIKSLQISKLGYNDTLVVELDNATRYRNIEISMKQEDTIPGKKIIDFEKFKPGWLVPEKLKINARNITTPVFKSVQLSLIPTLSTNRFLGGAAINEVSINLTVGYVQEIRSFEVGTLLNFVRNNVSYFQAAGIANIVGGNATGFQAAGIFNEAKNVKGFQSAGIFNITNSMKGTQAAGIFNLTKSSATIQLAGIFNTSTQNEVQIAGILNKSDRSAVQTAGLINTSKNVAFQVAGLINNTDTLKRGTQIAGLINKSRTNSKFQVAGAINQTKGEASTQISGFINNAHNLTGFQLAPFNFADTSSGMSVGILSFIRKGYHKLEISADETFPYNLSFRTGTHKFHTFLSGGTTSLNFDQFLWNIGYGFGTSIGNPKKKLLFDIDLSANEIMYNSNFNGTYHWYKFYMGFDRKITKKISLAFGVSYNALLSDSFQPDYNEIDSRMPEYHLTNINFSNGHNLRTWIGGKVALRFF